VHKEQPKYPLVLIEWEDSQRPLSPWQWVDEYSLPDAVRCLSVGFLIAKTKAAFAIAPNLGDVDQERAQACGIIRIPACSVRKLTTLALSHPRLRGTAVVVPAQSQSVLAARRQVPRQAIRRSTTRDR
jgi:hypothetical protein